jgi:membrane-bound metal-dependent hydrolase YbcI (DUF457 family)
MFFFFHLFTGVVLGLLIGDLLSDNRWIVPCIVGAVIPDIVDKPLNFILVPAVNGNGRFLFHNLLVLLILMAIGLLLWNYYSSPIILSLDIGILSHQILDSMWTDPVRWLYPLLGPYLKNFTAPPDFIFTLLGSDLFNPSEWIIIVLLGLCVLLYVKYRKNIAENPKTGAILKACLLLCALVCCMLGGIAIGRGLARQPLAFTGYTNPLEYIMGGIVIVLAAYVSWRLHDKI